MSLQGAIEARCPSCTELFEAAIWSFVHGGTDIALRDQIKARECNLLLCAHCGKAFMPDVSWIYYEPSAEILAFIFPESWKDEAEKWARYAIEHIPQDVEFDALYRRVQSTQW
jgi:phage FluMu protein Com